MCQDMLEVGSRLHRKGANKNCRKIINGMECGNLETVNHRLVQCSGVSHLSEGILDIVEKMLDRKITVLKLCHLSFNHRNKARLQVTIWFVIKALYEAYSQEEIKRIRTWQMIVREIQWSISTGLVIGSFTEMQKLERLVMNDIAKLIHLKC